MAAPASSIQVQSSDVERSRYETQLRSFPWLLIAPTIALLAALTLFPLLSPATASRDLTAAVDAGSIERKGDKATSRYRFAS